MNDDINYCKTPDNFPIIKEISNTSCCKTDDTTAHVCYDANALYLPYAIASKERNIVCYLKIDKKCIMDAIKTWELLESIKNESNDYDCSDDLINKDSDIRFDNMIVKGVLALNNREYKEEKEISDDE